MAKKLSLPQQDALDAIDAVGGYSIPARGGYWCDSRGNQIETRNRSKSVLPTIGTRTIRSLVDLGELIEYGSADYGGRMPVKRPGVTVE